MNYLSGVTFMKKLLLLLALCLPVVLTGCSTVTVHTDKDPRVNFAKYKSYAYSPKQVDGGWSPTTIDTIQTSIDAGLQGKGYTESSKPSFYVSYHIVRKDHQHVSTIATGTEPMPGGYWYNDYGYGNYYGFWPEYTQTYVDVSHYQTGTLIVDFIDAKSHLAIWRGSATAVVEDPTTNHNNLAAGIQKMLTEFPARP